MDRTETLAKKYLDTLGFDSIVYEPDGNIPPDFLANNKVAIEVTRLNQHINHNGIHRGLQETGQPLWDSLEKLLKEFNTFYNGKSYFVLLHYRRPIQKLKTLRPQFRKVLEKFLKNPVTGGPEYNVTETISLQFLETSIQDKNTFIMGGASDLNSGGFVISELERNIRICLDKKTNLIKRHRAKYPEWWLILADTIGYGLSEYNRKEFRKVVSIENNWDKVILIDPTNPVKAYII
ncbi:MAG: hypothetical protein WBB23_24030 [Desulforhopalus sp.]